MPEPLSKFLTGVRAVLSASTAYGLIAGGLAFSIGMYLGWPSDPAKFGATFAVPAVMIVWGITFSRKFSVKGLVSRLDEVSKMKSLSKNEISKIRNIIIEEFAGGRGVGTDRLTVTDKIETVVRDVVKKEIQRLLPKLTDEVDKEIDIAIKDQISKTVSKDVALKLKGKVVEDFDTAWRELKPKLAVAIRRFVIEKFSAATDDATKNITKADINPK